MSACRMFKRVANVVVAGVIAVSGGFAGTAYAIGEACPTPITQYTNTISNSSPQDLVAGGDGALWFTESPDAGVNKIGRVTTSGTITNYAVPGFVFKIFAGPGGTTWFIGKNSSDAMMLARVDTGGVQAQYSINNSYIPDQVVLGSDGAFWVATHDTSLVVIARITTSGSVTEYPLAGLPGTAYGYVGGMASGPDGAVWFAFDGSGEGENDVHRLGRMAVSDGSVTWSLSSSTYDQQGYSLGGVTYGPDGAFWVVGSKDGYGQFLLRVTTSGGYTEHDNDQFAAASVGATTAGPDGNLWFMTDSKVGRIVLSPFTVNEYGIATDLTSPVADYAQPVVGADGALWVASGEQNRLTRFDPSDVPTVAEPEIAPLADGAIHAPNLQWSAVTGATSYKICRDGVVIAATASTSYDDASGPDGNHFYAVVATDASGNNSSPAGLLVDVDNFGPTFDDPQLTLNPLYHGEVGQVDIHNVADANGIQKYEYSVDDGPRRAMTTTVPANGHWVGYVTSQYGYAPTDLSDGMHTVHVIVTDVYGKETSKSVDLFVGTLDAPAGVTTNSPTNNQPVVQWQSVTGADHYNIYRDGGSTPIMNTTSTSYTDTASLTDGAHTYKVTAVDARDGESDPSQQVSVTVDKTAPSVSSLTLNPTLVLLTSNLTITANASDAGAGIASGEYYIDTDPGQGNATPMTYSSGTGKVSATRSGGLLDLTTGSHTVGVRVKDTAGNWSTVVTATFTKVL